MEAEAKIDRHSAPGSQAGPRRALESLEDEVETDRALRNESLLDGGGGAEPSGRLPTMDGWEDSAGGELEYDFGDAVLDDLVGNTSGLSHTPTPEPTYYDGRYDELRESVSGMMGERREYLALAAAEEEEDKALMKELGLSGDKGGGPMVLTTVEEPPLPTDRQISLLLRSYRDKNSSRHGNASSSSTNPPRPLGLVRALKFLLNEPDISTPMSSWGERTYTTLLTCCSNPVEARRVLKMMDDADSLVARDHPHRPAMSRGYAYSILVDVHSRTGDFRGASKVLDEMRGESVPLTLPAYTSFLAGCYKVVNAGAAPPSLKAEAGKEGWERWKEMRAADGLDPDVMAYGSIMRLTAARGLAERCVSILEEMDLMQVKPTTLIYTAALRAVARSHAIALRFSGGYSRSNKKRERIASHHGRMTRDILIRAEASEVPQDDGFVSALMLCAATAGDSATAKAIYLASEVRRMKHLRSVGGDGHLSALEGATTDRVRAIGGEPSDDGAVGVGGEDVTAEEIDIANDRSHPVGSGPLQR